MSLKELFGLFTLIIVIIISFIIAKNELSNGNNPRIQRTEAECIKYYSNTSQAFIPGECIKYFNK